MMNYISDTNNFQISIIIPVYNAEKYLKECLDSLLEQNFNNFEVICVNDGSTDSSPLILEEYQRKDKRIRILHQNNQFAGVARNTGLKEAKGKYVLFLDADDFFCENMLEKLWVKAESETADIVVFDAFLYDNQLKQVINTPWRALVSDESSSSARAAFEMPEIIFDFTIPVPWNKLFLREFILKNKLYFQPLKRTNDLFFVYAALSCAERITILNEKLLYYRDNNDTSLQGKGEQTPTIFLEALYALKEYLEKKDYWDIYKNSFENMALTMCFYNLNNMKNKEIFCFLYAILKEEAIYKLLEEHGIESSAFLEYIASKQNLIVYGAGAVAESLINILLYIYNYEREKLKVVVTDKVGNKDILCHIPIQEFRELEYQEGCLIAIAVMQEKIQDMIAEDVMKRGYNKIVKIGYRELSTIVISN